ncbi:MAG: prepilin-type N-terminal cleavage/methylation domain-containing protein [Motiliproteus sp.]
MCIPSPKFGIKPQQETGFTLIELISVLLVLSITAVVVLPRFTGTQSYRDLLLNDQLILIARYAQQTALTRHNQGVTLELSVPSSDWLFAVQVDLDNDSVNDLEVKRLELERGSSTLTMNSPSTIAVNSPTRLRISYDNLGNLTRVNGLAVSSNLHFDAGGRSMCLSLAGYAYESSDQASCVAD